MVAQSARNLWTIFRHEFSLYFGSPIVYFIGALWFLFVGVFFSISVASFNQGAPLTMDNTISTMGFLAIFIAPGLTMRLISEEMRTGTHELLLTAPVRDWEVVVGKWLGAWGVLTVFVLISLIFPLILTFLGSPDGGDILTAYIGLWLLWGMALAIGVMASAMTPYQIIAFIISLALLIGLWLAQAVFNFIPNPLIQEIASEATIFSHFQNTMVQRGIIQVENLVYFIGVIAIALFLATNFLGTRRWRA
ncbi:MAG: ABC transporter permease subunit [Chloroflexi bacterium]|nr:ABC transporter permease subunit [Chloroflexota bacterium]